MPKRNSGPRLRWRKDRNQWEIQWFDHGRRKARSTGCTDREAAAGQLALFITEREAGRISGPTDRLIADVLLAYDDERAPETIDPNRIHNAVLPLLDFFGPDTASQINETRCKAYAQSRFHKDRETGLPTVRRISDGTIRRELGVLRAALNHDFQRGRLAGPVPAVWRPQNPEPKDRWLTRDEAARLLWAARTRTIKSKGKGKPPKITGGRHLTLFILIGLYTAARKEAILSLKWDQVDLERRVIDFNVVGRKRTKKGRAVIRIPRRLCTFLKYEQRFATPFDHVIRRGGKPLKDVKKGFGAAAQRAQLDGVTPHTLRHTSASWMAQADVPMPLIAQYLGHRNSRITEEIYAKYSPSYMQRAADALDRGR